MRFVSLILRIIILVDRQFLEVETSSKFLANISGVQYRSEESPLVNFRMTSQAQQLNERGQSRYTCT